MSVVVRSSGLLVAPFADGAAVFDPITETTHLIGPLAAWLVSSRESTSLGDLVQMLVEETGVDGSTARDKLSRAVATLTDVGLLGRTDQPEPIEPMEPNLRAPEPGWTVGASHGLLDEYLAFCGPDPELIAAIDTFMGAPVDRVEPTMYFGIRPVGSGGIDVIDSSRWHLADRGRLLWQLPTIVNYTVSHSGSMVVLHAGAVRTPQGAIVLVTGPINTGKSTLIAALVRAGCDYLGDESIGIDNDTLHAWGYPKPLTLDPTSQHLAGLDPVGEPITAGEHRRAEEIRPETKSLSGAVGPVDLVIHTAYRPDSQPERVQLSAPQAVELLITNTLNLARSGEQGLSSLCRLAETVPVVSITHDDTVGLAEHIVSTGGDPTRLIDESTGGRSRHRSHSRDRFELDAWWFEWEPVHVTPVTGLKVFPLEDASLVVAPGLEARVIDEFEAAVCGALVGQSTIADVAGELGVDAECGDDKARAAVLDAVQRLQAAGMVSLDRQPDVAIPEIDSHPDLGAGRREISNDLSAVRPVTELGVSSGATLGFDPERRPTEASVGVLNLVTPNGPMPIEVRTDVADVVAWLQTLPTAVFDPAPVAEPEGSTPLRVLGSLGVDDETSFVLAGSTGWGPVSKKHVPAAICRAAAHIAHVEPPGGHRFGPVWVSEYPAGWRVHRESSATEIEDGAFWIDELWLADDGKTLWVFDAETVQGRIATDGATPLDLTSPDCWLSHPLDRLIIDEDIHGGAEEIAATLDLLRLGSSGRLKAQVDLAVDLAARHKLHSRPPRGATNPPTQLPPSIEGLAGAGALGEYSHSIKLGRENLADNRMMWEWILPQGDGPDQRDVAARVMGEFATGDEVAETLVKLVDRDATFVVGVDRHGDGTTDRHKLYVQITEKTTWNALVATFPAVGALHDSSVLSAAGEVEYPPRYVAWKRIGPPDRTIMSVYRRQHDPEVTVRAAITGVLPEGSEWVEPACALIGPDREMDDLLGSQDLEVIEEGGRHSVDLHVSDPAPRGERLVVARWLAALAGLDAAAARRWADHVARLRPFRLIVGTDGAGDPFLSVYCH